MTLFIYLLVALCLAHIACDVAGVPMGRQVRWLFKPAVWLIYGLTFGRVNLAVCKACREREKYLDNLFGKS